MKVIRISQKVKYKESFKEGTYSLAKLLDFVL
jgi:hypothetical protein